MPITTVIDNITYIFTEKLFPNKIKSSSIICNPIDNYENSISNLLKKLV